MPNGKEGEGEGKGKETPKEKARRLSYLNPDPDKRDSTGLGSRANFLVSGVISLILAVLVVFLMAPMKGDFQDLSTSLETQFSALSSNFDSKFANSQTTVTNQVSSFTGRVATLESKVSGLSGLEGKVNTAISGIDAKIAAAIQTRIAKLDARILVLEAEEEEEEAATEDVVRWNFKDARITWSTNPPTNIAVGIDDVDPRRVEEEGLYEVELRIMNQGIADWAMGSLEFELVLEPRSYCPINEDDTYLDSDDYPWLNWDTDFVMKTREGEEVCRRVVFTSDRYNFATTLQPDQSYTLDLVLELYYEKQ